MKIRSVLSFVVGFATIAGLSGCGDRSGNILGFEKSAPDEFAVVKRAPLTLPPEYGLRPPRPGAVAELLVAVAAAGPANPRAAGLQVPAWE